MSTLAATRSRPTGRTVTPWPSGPGVLGAAVWLGAGLVFVLWWQGADAPIGRGAGFTEAGRLTGLLAGYVAMVQVLLRARLGVVERGLGTDRINSTHRLLGCYLIALVLGHVTLIGAGYARAAHQGWLPQIWSLINDYPYVAWSGVGAAMLVTVAISSAPPVRRLLRHGGWHAMHLLVYPALVLAFFHQVAVGEHFLHNRTLRWAWTAAWIATAVLVLAARWLGPVALFARHRLRVAAVREEASGVVSVEFTGRRLDRFPAEPGQYFRWRFLARGHWLSAHPYSLSRAPDGRRLRITATVHGRSSSRLPELSPGTAVLAEGPSGGLAVPAGWTGPVLLIGGGVGITPLRALLETCPGTPIVLVHRIRDAGDALFARELTEIAVARGVTVHQVVGPRAEVEFTGDSLEQLFGPLDRAWICICGSAGFVRYVRADLTRCGARRGQLSTESFEMA